MNLSSCLKILCLSSIFIFSAQSFADNTHASDDSVYLVNQRSHQYVCTDQSHTHITAQSTPIKSLCTWRKKDIQKTMECTISQLSAEGSFGKLSVWMNGDRGQRLYLTRHDFTKLNTQYNWCIEQAPQLIAQNSYGQILTTPGIKGSEDGPFFLVYTPASHLFKALHAWEIFVKEQIDIHYTVFNIIPA